MIAFIFCYIASFANMALRPERQRSSTTPNIAKGQVYPLT